MVAPPGHEPVTPSKCWGKTPLQLADDERISDGAFRLYAYLQALIATEKDIPSLDKIAAHRKVTRQTITTWMDQLILADWLLITQQPGRRNEYICFEQQGDAPAYRTRHPEMQFRTPVIKETEPVKVDPVNVVTGVNPKPTFEQKPLHSKHDIGKGAPSIEVSAKYHAYLLGVEVFPVEGKQPAQMNPQGKRYLWKQHELGKPGVHGASMYAWKHATGYGMKTVKGDTLVFLDIDRKLFEREALTLIPRLKDTYRQQRRTHSCYAFRLPVAIQQRYQIADKQGEIASLRGYGSYQVGAGSMHPTGTRYKGNSKQPIDLSEVEAKALIVLFENRSGKVSNSTQPHVMRKPTPITIRGDKTSEFKRWLQKQVDDALGKLHAAVKGEYNDRLYKATFRIKALAQYTGQTDSEIESVMMAEANASGYISRDGESQARKTVRSGIQQGKNGTVELPKKFMEVAS